MPVFKVNDGKLTAANATSFHIEGLRERQDIRRMLREQIAILGEDLFVLSDGYGAWIDSNRRIDLMCVGALIEGGYRSDRGDWPRVQQVLLDAILRLERVIKPHLNKLKQG
ncbi:hypothetical protein C8J45_1195 [Sphingomonas sp. PP-CE-3G-477]|uniref:hypothetical protein n=1 Tax=Sphingomonas sp. PP-CE-3G-477 TaxID=2135660 RepID=UPI000D421EEF|nr:hypothetical protein [Sphingomonas sp. PP-CE-3G-477]PTQ58581.1 hypothetical protein C8J45_1195 [Sphingomonas sp. PP-CE-3G-477]